MKCSICKKEHDAFGGHICAGRTVAAISTDAIKYCIKWVSPEIPKKDYKGNMPSIAREQLSALISENSQLKARVKDLEKDNSIVRDVLVRVCNEFGITNPMQLTFASENNEETNADILIKIIKTRIATLEQQLKDAKKEVIEHEERYAQVRDLYQERHGVNIDTIIQQVEKRILVWVIENKNTTMLDVTDVDRIHGEYKQARVERDRDLECKDIK